MHDLVQLMSCICFVIVTHANYTKSCDRCMWAVASISSMLNKSVVAAFGVVCGVHQLVANAAATAFSCCDPPCPAFARGDAMTNHPAAAHEQEAGAPGAGWAAKQSTRWLVLMRASWASTSSRCTTRGELSDSASLATRGASSAGTMGPTCITHHPLVPLYPISAHVMEIVPALHRYAHVCMGASC